MIRPIQPEDAPAVCEIFVRSLGYEDCTTEVVRQRIDELGTDERSISLVWVDEATAQVRGFIHALRYDTLHNLGGWDVISLAVAPDAQGQGIGQALLRATEDEAVRRGGAFIRLNSSLKRTQAHAFYEHLGYTSLKTQKHFIKRIGEH